MKRPRFIAFHLAMVIVYIVLFFTWERWTRMAITLWAAALTGCSAGFLICVILALPQLL